MMNAYKLKHIVKGLSNLRTRTYTTALTRKVSSSISNALSINAPKTPINIQRAISQHEAYVEVLREIIGLKTIEIEADEAHPDCVFIEDTAVVISNVAVITKIGAESRRGEVDAVKRVLLDLGMQVHDMREDGNGATLDGGDVLHPVTSTTLPEGEKGGKHLFVGVSSRTNLKGVYYLAEKFSHLGVIPVNIESMGSLHLKSIVTHIDENTLLVPDGSLGTKISGAMDFEGWGYDFIRLNDPNTCNVVSLNGHVLAQPTKCKHTEETLQRCVDERGMNLVWVEANEFAKVDGALTCKSILM
mmetsp:Transcript_23050/g.34321  ORF Transcript_23050/g.34321 Transcript_23050/m.34321 type:complete len:301 (+) Transcript_23050:86-988(+)